MFCIFDMVATEHCHVLVRWCEEGGGTETVRYEEMDGQPVNT